MAKIEEVMAIQDKFTGEEYDEDILDEDVSGVIKLGFKFNKKIYNINEKVEIDMPKLTKENSVDMNELMKARSESFSQMYHKDI